jgi:hypothetical protein
MGAVLYAWVTVSAISIRSIEGGWQAFQSRMVRTACQTG